MRRKLAAGNWKMNGTGAALDQLVQLAGLCPGAAADIVICPPATLIHRAAQATDGTNIRIGGQDCHAAQTGAHTGDISAQMLLDAGAQYVIVGHSERRQDHDEHNEDVRAKARIAMASGLVTIVCMGESQAERVAENTLDIIGGQLAGSIPDAATGENLVVAYEPIWAIGTGLVPTLDQIAEVHDFIRARLVRRFGADIGQKVRILYGGSVNPGNADSIFAVPNVDGALVGGASLKATDFAAIVQALQT